MFQLNKKKLGWWPAALSMMFSAYGCNIEPDMGDEGAASTETRAEELTWSGGPLTPIFIPPVLSPVEQVRTETFETPFGPFELTYTVDSDGTAWLEDDIELDLEWLRAEVQAAWDEYEEMEPGVGDPGDGFGQTAQGLAAWRESKYFWPSANVYYTVDPDLYVNGSVPSRITGAIQHWEDNTPLRFIPRTNQRDYVAFVEHDDKCSSSVGRQGGRQKINLAAGCSRGAIIHEIGHAVGLFHEQARSDRDHHVRILRDNIKDGKDHNFNKYSDNTFLFWGAKDGQDVGPYDFGSIMHYGSYYFSKNNQPTLLRRHNCPNGNCEITPNRSALSHNDKRYIHELYCPLVGWDANRCGKYLTPDPGFAWSMHPDGELDLCLDVKGASTGAHAKVQSYACHGRDNQLWTITPTGDGHVYVRAKHSGLCLDVPGGSSGRVEIQQYTCHRGDNQKWFLDEITGYVYGPDRHARHVLRNARHRDMCLFINSENKLVQEFCSTNSPNIRHRWFQFIAQESNFDDYELVNARSGECLDVPGLSRGDVNVQDYPCNGGSNQTWRFRPRPNHTFALEAKHSGRCLDVLSNAYIAPVGQRTCDEADDGQWFSPHLTSQGKIRLWKYWPSKCIQRNNSGDLEAGVCDRSTPNSGAHWQINPR